MKRGLLLRWIAANTLPTLLIHAVYLLTGQSGPLAQAVNFGVFIVALGLAQWSVLRLYFQQMSWTSWLLATALGQILGYLLGIVQGVIFFFFSANFSVLGPVLGTFLNIALITVASGTALGICMGYTQWRVLRRYLAVQRESTWVLSNIATQVIIAVLPPPLLLMPTKDPHGACL